MNVVRIMAVTSLVQIVLGLLAYCFLASIADVLVYKLFSLFGLFLNICGVLFLSELAISASQKHYHLFDYLYAFVWAGLYNFSLGMIVGSVCLIWFDLPSSVVVVSFAVAIGLYVAFPLYVFDYVGEIFRLGFYETVKKRIVFLGWYLLLAGMSLQLIGVILDLVK